MNAKQYGIIVDGYSSGGEFARILHSWGITCIHVQSNAQIPEVYRTTFHPEYYEINLIFNDNWSALVAHLQNYQPKFVLAGAEPGVELSDQLAHALGLPGNDLALSHARRNKYFMMEQVRISELNYIPQFKSAHLSELIAWAEQQAVWPLVVKPLNSAGGDLVSICRSIDEVAVACQAILAKPINMLGFPNNEVLIQHFVLGEEYVINFAVRANQFVLCEIWSYQRFIRGSYQIYDSASLIQYDPVLHSAIVEYAKQAAISLGIKMGAVHAEIMMTPEQKPVLIELAARVMGGNLPINTLSECLNGKCQALMTLLAYADQAHFDSLAQTPYQLTKNFTAVFLVSHAAGDLRAINHVAKIQELASFGGLKLRVNPSSKIYKTVDYETSPGMLYLTHANPKIIELDMATVRSFELSDMYELTGTS